MNNQTLKRTLGMLVLLLILALPLTGCGQSNDDRSATEENNSESALTTGNTAIPKALTVRFGDGGKPFTMNLYENETAIAIAKYVGTAVWRLPIYNYDNFENWEVMQYYDIPSRYEIPSAPETITEEKAGEVYYSAPNRIVLFYGDAQVNGEYTKIGYFDFNEDFKAAVESNPVLESSKNKMINISPGE